MHYRNTELSARYIHAHINDSNDDMCGVDQWVVSVEEGEFVSQSKSNDTNNVA